MSEIVIWNPGTILFPIANATLRLYQPHYRRNILLDQAAMGWIDNLVTAADKGILRCDAADGWNASWRIKDATKFNIFDNAYENSAMFDADATLVAGDKLTCKEVLELLIDVGILATQWPIEYKHDKQHFGDAFRGSFYEQIGTACLMNRRIPTEWWADQKFEKNRLSTRLTAYHYVQDRFLDGFLEDHVAGKSIIEVGCGTGYYTNRMAQVSDKAVGVDYNSDYIDIAKKTWSGQGEGDATYAVLDIIDFSTDQPELIAEPFDYVIMIDTFLFLFHESYQPQLFSNRKTVLQNLAKLVKKDGRILIMDPHPLFLTPFFGDPNRPFGILESYNSHYFRVAPTLAEITELLEDAGLAIARIFEPKPHPDFDKVNPKSHKFYSEVPMWHMLELIVR